jgi:hypothetical protein
LITARDMAIATLPAATLPVAPPVYAPVQAAGRGESLLRGTLYLTMLLSCIAFIEPSPHDAFVGVLLFVALIAGVKVDRILAPLILLLVAWNIGGLLSLLNVPNDSKAIQYAATSVYLCVAALVFAAVLSHNTMPRLAALRSGYIVAAVITAIAGTIGYFNLVPQLYDVLTLYGRAVGFFKDPNVYGPYLIWPALFLIARMLTDGIRMRDSALLGIILVGLLLSFSRGAWFHFALSGAVMLALFFVSARSQMFRFRLLGMTGVGLAVLAALVVIMLSIPQVRELFLQRANAINSYDVGEGGRFQLQELALGAIFDFPNGMGPFEFARVHGLQQHNVYLQAFIVYGWIGGVSYLLMLAATLMVGLRSALAPTPWQPYAVTAVAAFIGEVVEGMVIDTDHWRHFFLLLGMIWGLAAATRNARLDLLLRGGFANR